MAETATVGELLVRIRADVTDLERGLNRTQNGILELSTRTRPGLRGVENAFRGLAFSAASVPGPVGRVGTLLLRFGTGGTVTIAVLAGIAAIGGVLKLLEYRASQLEKKWKDLQLAMQFEGVHERSVLAAIQRIVAQDPVERIKQIDQAIRSLRQNMRLFEPQTVRRTGAIGLLEDVVLPGDPEKLSQARQAIKLLLEERNRLVKESTAAVRAQKDALLEAEAAVRRWNDEWERWAGQARAAARIARLERLREELDKVFRDMGLEFERSQEIQESWRNLGYAIGDYFVQGFQAATSGGLGSFLKSLGFTLLRGVIFGGISAATGGTFGAGFGAATGLSLSKVAAPSLAISKVAVPSLAKVAAPSLAIDFSTFPPAQNPLAAARDRDWQHFFRESGLVARAGGFRG